MRIFKVEFGATDGTTNWSSQNVRAKDFDEAYQRGKTMAGRQTRDIQAASAKGKKEDKVSKSFAVVVAGIKHFADCR